MASTSWLSILPRTPRPSCAPPSTMPGRPWRSRASRRAPDRKRLSFAATIAEAVKDADFIQENAPEREELKQDLLAEIDAAPSPRRSSPPRPRACCRAACRRRWRTRSASSSATPSTRSISCRWSRCSAGKTTSPRSIEAGKGLLHLDRHAPALHVRVEIEGFIADRLMEALWREALWLVNDGVATTEEIDAAVVYGCGLRWSLMGTFLTFHLAGGEGGMRHMLHQFGPALKLPWTKLVAPELTEELIDRVADGCEHQAAGRPIKRAGDAPRRFPDRAAGAGRRNTGRRRKGCRGGSDTGSAGILSALPLLRARRFQDADETSAHPGKFHAAARRNRPPRMDRLQRPSL